MKLLAIILSLSIVLCTAGKAQKLDSLKSNKQTQYRDYMRQSRTAKTVAWALLGAGAIMTSASYLSYANNGFNGPWGGAGVFTFGCVAGAASIPIFVLGAVDKHKANLALKAERSAGRLYQAPSYPALAFTIHF